MPTVTSKSAPRHSATNTLSLPFGLNVHQWSAGDGLAYWVIDEQMFPRRVVRGCNNLGTPASYDGIPTRHTALKLDSIESMELSDINSPLRAMDAEDIAIQVVYPSLF